MGYTVLKKQEFQTFSMTRSMALLLVDDDPLAIQVLKQALPGYGDICFATSGQQAIAHLARQPVDLVLLDAQMPNMDGYATCRAIKAEYPDIPVIFVTASTSPESEVHALDSGAVDFITKPINPPVVRARVSTQLQLKQQADQLRALVKSDPLTGIANRRALDEHAALEWRRAQRNNKLIAVLMIDIDFFKAYNDHYGHIEGDHCLRRVATTIDTLISRPADLTARFGGEEFAVLLPESSGPQALRVAEKIRQSIESLNIPHARSPTSSRVTVSIGVAVGMPRFPAEKPEQPGEPDLTKGGSYQPQHLEALFNLADAALYEAKQSGRNRVVMNTSAETRVMDATPH